MLPFSGSQDTGSLERLSIRLNFVLLWSTTSKLSCIPEFREHRTRTMLQILGMCSEKLLDSQY